MFYRETLFLVPLTILSSLIASSFAFAYHTSCSPLFSAHIEPKRSIELHLTSSSQAQATMMQFFQHKITITAPSRGCHLITNDIYKAAADDMRNIKVGMCNLFIQHTSASLSINENADPSVRTDIETALNKLVPAKWTKDGTFEHTMEGEDDMPGHVKSSLMGVSLNIPISNGRLALGTWQGVYLNEHRNQGGWGGGHARNIVITLQGQA